MPKYHANGKLLLTGEYFVLHGSKSIALPLKSSQNLYVFEGLPSNSLLWYAFYNGAVWFWCELDASDFSVIAANNMERAIILKKIFLTIQSMNPNLPAKAGTRFESVLDANPEWGFGSSSTLISLLSQWANVDPYKLNEMIFNGSGFDIACATAEGPIFYIRNKQIQPVELKYPFSNQLFFVYSGKKKETRTEVSTFLNKAKVSDFLINEISKLSDEFADCHEQIVFNQLICEHEKIVGNLIRQTPVKEDYFHDFEGEIKSLGAWGGDFYLISTDLPALKVNKYFENKGLSTIFSWNELIIKRDNQ